MGKQKVPFSMQQSQEIEKLIQECIQQNDLDTGGAKICGLMVTPYISPTTAGKCIRAGKQLKFFSDYDYIIQISKDYWDNLKEETRKILVLHECLHIKTTYKKDGTILYQLNQHDVEDFAQLLDKYGVHWLRQVNLVKEHLQDKDNDEKNSNWS